MPLCPSVTQLPSARSIEMIDGHAATRFATDRVRPIPIREVASLRARARANIGSRLTQSLLLALMLVLLDAIFVRDRGHPGAAAGRHHAHAVVFLANLGAWGALPQTTLPAAGLQHGSLAPPVRIQDLRYKERTIFLASPSRDSRLLVDRRVEKPTKTRAFARARFVCIFRTLHFSETLAVRTQNPLDLQCG